MSTIKPLFTWIHLSDIHVGHGDANHAADQELVLNELKNDLRDAAAQYLPPPDAIFVTGDLAFSGNVLNKDEYKRVGTWLRQIAALVSLSEDRIFIVPGNHDVQRNVEENDSNVLAMLKQLRAGELKVDNVLADRGNALLLRSRFSNYLSFAKTFAPACLSKPRATELFWTHELPVSSKLTLLLVGLNTALLATKEEDEFGDRLRLQSGTKQLAHAFSALDQSPNQLRILLSHHPFDWLRDGVDVAATTRKYAHVHLCGHVHNAETSHVVFGSGQQMITVTAGAVHEDAKTDTTTYRHGYNFAAVWERDDGRRMLRVWPRAWSKNREFRVDRDSLPGKDERGDDYRETYVDHELPLNPLTPKRIQNYGRSAQRIPLGPQDELPYVLNRNEQEENLLQALEVYRGKKSTRPFVCVVHGDELEGHRYYLKRLKTRSLPDILKTWNRIEAEKKSLQEFNIRLPLNKQTRSDYERSLWHILREVTHGSRPVSDKEIIEFLASDKLPVIIRCAPLSTEIVKDVSLDSIDWFFRFWEKWPEISNLLFFIAITFKYERNSESKLDFFKNRTRKRFNQQIRQYLKQVNFADYNIYGTVLPELVSIPRYDVEALIWQEQFSLYSYLDDQDIRTVYNDRTLCPDGRTIPMDQLLDRLIAICNEKESHNSRRL